MNQEDTGLCVVQTALPTEAQAAELARALVQQQLAACVQLQPVRSFYVWQGQAHDEAEWLLSIKTRSALYPRLEAWLREHHPYEVPEIVALPLTRASPAYRDWVLAQTA